MELLVCKNLCKDYGNRRILDHINLSLPRGKIIGLLGKNGAGKTTLIKLTNDLLTPTEGSITIEGEPIGIQSKKMVSYLPERTYLDKSMSVAAAIRYFAEFYEDFSTEKARELTQSFGLEINQKISKMSKGMQEKLQILLVMSRQAKLYILDEPLGGIDPATRDQILDAILDNVADGASLLISTHLISDVERILDEVIFLDGGKIVLEADADSLRERENASVDEIFRRQFRC